MTPALKDFIDRVIVPALKDRVLTPATAPSAPQTPPQKGQAA